MAKHAVLKTFYASEKWVKLRLRLINERGNICSACGKIVARSIKLIGHHKIELTPENVHDYNISLNPDLIELVCFDCHNKEHNRFGKRAERKIYLVYGPPMSGKSTYVKENILRGDIVIDMDRLYEAVTMLPYYDKPDQLFNNVIGLHNQLLDNIKTRFGKWTNAWVIGGYADKHKREKIANDIGAELIFCDVSQDECLRRLKEDEGRQYRQDEWEGYINKWFESYTK